MELVLLLGGLAFLLAWALQVLSWRILAVRREMLGLAVIFGLAPSALFLVAAATGSLDWRDALCAWVLAMAVACAYIQTYPALREDIPSFRILFAIGQAGPQGATARDIADAVNPGDLHSTKIADLAQDGLIRVTPGGTLELSPAGRLLARTFRIYRSALGLQRGLG